VPKNPIYQNDFIGSGSQICILQTYKVMISFLLFFSYFPTSIWMLVRIYCGRCNFIDCPVDGVECRFGCFSLLYYDYVPEKAWAPSILLSSNPSRLSTFSLAYDVLSVYICVSIHRIVHSCFCTDGCIISYKKKYLVIPVKSYYVVRGFSS